MKLMWTKDLDNDAVVVDIFYLLKLYLQNQVLLNTLFKLILPLEWE